MLNSSIPTTPLHKPLVRLRQVLLLAALAASLLEEALMAEMQMLTKTKPVVNKQLSLVHSELQTTTSAEPVNKLALHVLIDYQLHVKS
jgi:hypothetical protein